MTSLRKRQEQLQALWPELLRGDPGAVHEARKLTRRIGAELRVSGAKRGAKNAWRDLRRAIAPVRDRDATGLHLSAGLTELAAPPEYIERFRQDWDADRQQRWAEVVLPAFPPFVERPGDFKERAAERARKDWKALRREAEQVLDSADADAWHTWRKHLKAYRFTLGLLGEAPLELEELLHALGRIQDAEVAREILEEGSWLPEYRVALLEREERAHEGARRQARQLWEQLEKMNTRVKP